MVVALEVEAIHNERCLLEERRLPYGAVPRQIARIVIYDISRCLLAVSHYPLEHGCGGLGRLHYLVPLDSLTVRA